MLIWNIDPSQHIAIILPFRNAEPWLADCLHSIRRQSYRHWECVMVNDRSTDDSNSIARHFCKNDKRFEVFENEGEGIVDALNTALDQTDREWITRMDADDIMVPEKLERLLALVNGDGNCVATGKVRYFSPESVSEGYRGYESWLNERIDADDHWDWVYRECVIASANWLTHRSNVELPKDVYPEDYNLVFHWYAKGLKVRSTSEVTHLWREHPLRTSRTAQEYQQGAFFQLKTRQFAALDRDHRRPLAIMGKNAKATMLKSFLEATGDRPEVVDRQNFGKMDTLKRPQVLVGVFPGETERNRIASWLENHGLKMGEDWWWT